MERLIRHHLARGRTAALGGASRQSIDVAARLVDLASVMKKVHFDRDVVFQLDGPQNLYALCEAQDCDELFGNLLDNAFRHAASIVRATLQQDDGT